MTSGSCPDWLKRPPNPRTRCHLVTAVAVIAIVAVIGRKYTKLGGETLPNQEHDSELVDYLDSTMEKKNGVLIFTPGGSKLKPNDEEEHADADHNKTVKWTPPWNETKHLEKMKALFSTAPRHLKLQVRRYRKLVESCKEYTKTYRKRAPSKQNLHQRLRVYPDLKLVVCPINKVGSTYWRRFDVRFKGRRLSSYSSKEAKFIKQNFTKVIVVRHPLARFRSAYVDRFASLNPKYTSYIKAIMGIKNARTTCMDISMESVARYLIRTERRHATHNQHWRPYYRLCGLCDLDYDVIVKLETFDDDMQFLRKLVYFKPEVNTSMTFYLKKESKLKTDEDANISVNDQNENKNWVDAKVIDACRVFKPSHTQYPNLPSKCNERKRVFDAKVVGLRMKGYLREDESLPADVQNSTTWLHSCEKYIRSKFDDSLFVREIYQRKLKTMQNSLRKLDPSLFSGLVNLYLLDLVMFGYEPEAIFSLG